jgi:hypothetical protein
VFTVLVEFCRKKGLQCSIFLLIQLIWNILKQKIHPPTFTGLSVAEITKTGPIPCGCGPGSLISAK